MIWSPQWKTAPSRETEAACNPRTHCLPQGETGYSGFTQGLEGQPLRVLLTTSQASEAAVDSRWGCHKAQGRLEAGAWRIIGAPPRHSQHRRDDWVPSQAGLPGPSTTPDTKEGRWDSQVINTPPWGPGAAAAACSVPAEARLLCSGLGAPGGHCSPGPSWPRLPQVSAKKNKRSLRLAFFHSLVRLLVSRYRACQLGGRGFLLWLGAPGQPGTSLGGAGAWRTVPAGHRLGQQTTQVDTVQSGAVLLWRPGPATNVP